MENMPFDRWEVDPSQYEYSMNVIAIVMDNPDENNILNDGDEVAAFVGNEVRGSGKAIHIPQLNSYIIFMTIYSNVNNEVLTLKLFDASQNKEYNIIEKLDFMNNKVVGFVDNPMPMHLAVTSDVTDVDNKYGVYLHPNPFNGYLNVQFSLSDAKRVTLTIRDLLGKQVDKKYFDGKSGKNNMEWRPSQDVSGGSYIVTLESAESTYSYKILYIK